jgi:copper(I)-binding protein
MIHNNTGTDVTITDASSDAAKVTALHGHKDAGDGIMQMSQIKGGIPVPAGAFHEFARGGDHIMLMGLTSELKEGDVVTVTLTLEGAEPVTFEATVGGHAVQDGHDHSDPHSHSLTHAPAIDVMGMADDQAIMAIMKAQFETSDGPLMVTPVAVQGDHAIAAWTQNAEAGRTLLERRDGIWTIVLCAGNDLRRPDFLTEHGVDDALALSALFNAAEDALGADKVTLHSTFKAVVMIAPNP